MILRRSGWWMTGSGCSISDTAEPAPGQDQRGAADPAIHRTTVLTIVVDAPAAGFDGGHVAQCAGRLVRGKCHRSLHLRSKSNLYHRVVCVKTHRLHFPRRGARSRVTEQACRSPALEPIQFAPVAIVFRSAGEDGVTAARASPPMRPEFPISTGNSEGDFDDDRSKVGSAPQHRLGPLRLDVAGRDRRQRHLPSMEVHTEPIVAFNVPLVASSDHRRAPQRCEITRPLGCAGGRRRRRTVGSLSRLPRRRHQLTAIRLASLVLSVRQTAGYGALQPLADGAAYGRRCPQSRRWVSGEETSRSFWG